MDPRSQHQNREVAWGRLAEQLDGRAARRDHDELNTIRQDAHAEFRTWTWCGWRDEVKTPTGVKASMRKVLAGRLGLVI
ncbi:peptide chain release factor-like protein [Nocardioides sp. InS609-2]|uniref:peptide chain release factor-like protein n=1 Tax=Nocardioides sp. InS609-2 TaxID=2760705 RepID=UPI0020BF2B8F|nr:peptide chain release factor-like protein [Nocardioides sp. InS609-2]